MMFNFYPWGLSVNIVSPVDVNKTKVEFLTYMWQEDKNSTLVLFTATGLTIFTDKPQG